MGKGSWGGAGRLPPLLPCKGAPSTNSGPLQTARSRLWATRHIGVLFCPAPPRPAARPCAAPTRTARGMFGFWIRHGFDNKNAVFPHRFAQDFFVFSDMPCMKIVYRDKKESVHWSAARNEERARSRGSTAHQPRINRGSTADFVPPSVYMWFLLFVLPGHALHEKGLQRQIGVVPLVNSQQRRALAVPVINR